MNKKIQTLFFLISIVLLALSSYASITPAAENTVGDKYIRVTMVNQEPDPVEPGKFVTVKFKVVNYGRLNTRNIIVGIDPKSPFTLAAGQDTEQDIGVLRSRQYGEDAELVEWRLLVDKDAPEGTNYINIYYQEEGSVGVITFDDTFEIDIRTSDAVVNVVEITTEPEIVQPGKEAILKVKLKNNADSAIKDIKVKLNFTNLDISTLGSTNQQIIQKMDGQAEDTLEFIIIPDADIDVAIHKIPLDIEFKDNVNNAYSQNNSFGLKISSPIQYMVYIDASDVKMLNKYGEVTVKISNTGVNDIKFLTAELKPSPAYEIISAPSIYIGKVESDDYETVSYDIYTNNFDEGNTIKLRMLLTFTDNFNEEFVVEEEVDLQLFSTENALKFGILAKPSYTGLIILVFIIIGVVWFIIYRKWKKKQMMKDKD